MSIVSRFGVNFSLWVSLFCTSGMGMHSEPSRLDPRDEVVLALLANCTSADESYALGCDLQKGKYAAQGLTEQSPYTSRGALMCFLAGAEAGKREAFHKIGMMVLKLGRPGAAYPFFSIAAHQGLSASEKNKQTLKLEHGLIPPHNIFATLRTVESLSQVLSPKTVERLLNIITTYKLLPSQESLAGLNTYLLTEQTDEKLEESIAYWPKEAYRPLNPSCRLPHTEDRSRFLQKILQGLKAFYPHPPELTPLVQAQLDELVTSLSDLTFFFHVHSADEILQAKFSPNPWYFYNKEQFSVDPHLKTVRKVGQTVFQLLTYYNYLSLPENYGIIPKGSIHHLGYVKEGHKFIPFHVRKDLKGLVSLLFSEALEFDLALLNQGLASPGLLDQVRFVLLDQQGIVSVPGIVLGPVDISSEPEDC